MTALRRSLLAAGAAAGALALARPHSAAAQAAAPTAPAAPAAVWQFTYLKALPGRVDALARFIEVNWFAMDARARAAGHIEDYVLLRGAPADSAWDLVEVTVFRDSTQHAQADSLYRTLYRPAHRTVRVGGLGLAELGRIVGSTVTRRLAGRAGGGSLGAGGPVGRSSYRVSSPASSTSDAPVM